jgi:hypothetical protein
LADFIKPLHAKPLGIAAICRQKGAVTPAKALSRITVRPLHVALLAAAALGAAALVAQIEGERGVPPIASGGDFEVSGVKVDVFGPAAEAARTAGWRQAQRIAWKMLWTRTNGGAAAPGLSDSQLDAIVSGIEVEYEQNGPNRYIATLGVLFDRARAGQILGFKGQGMRSPPLLVIPVMWDSGAATSYESVNGWQEAWARFRTGESAIDYVRTSGTSADPLLLNAGQAGRRSRLWWRVLLDQYGAADVIMPIARLHRLWPGGPVEGRFTARYGPDNSLIGAFALRAPNPGAVPAMLDEAVRRVDRLYVGALTSGQLRPDPSLVIEEPVDPATLAADNMADAIETVDVPVAASGVASVSIQYDTPNVGSVSQGESAMRGIPGVRSAATSSLALGGTSVMQVSFEGTVDALRAALQARGYTVVVSGNTLRITRRQGSPGQAPGQ